MTRNQPVALYIIICLTKCEVAEISSYFHRQEICFSLRVNSSIVRDQDNPNSRHKTTNLAGIQMLEPFEKCA